MNCSIVELPENIKPSIRGKSADPTVVALAEEVAKLKTGQAVKLTVASYFSARQTQQRVRARLLDHYGLRMRSKTDGLGSMYLIKGEPIKRDAVRESA